MFADRRGQSLVCFEFEDGAVVFDGRTGDTHSLAAPLFALLKRLMAAAEDEIDAVRGNADPAALAQLAALDLF